MRTCRSSRWCASFASHAASPNPRSVPRAQGFLPRFHRRSLSAFLWPCCEGVKVTSSCRGNRSACGATLQIFCQKYPMEFTVKWVSSFMSPTNTCGVSTVCQMLLKKKRCSRYSSGEDTSVASFSSHSSEGPTMKSVSGCTL